MKKLKREICFILEKNSQSGKRTPYRGKKSEGGLLVELVFALFIGAVGCVMLFCSYFSLLSTGIHMKSNQVELLSELDTLNFIGNEIAVRGIRYPNLIEKKNRCYFLFVTEVDGERKVVGYYAYNDEYNVNHIKRFASSDEKLLEKVSKKEEISEGYLRKRIDGWNTLYEGENRVEFQLKSDEFLIVKIGEHLASYTLE